MSNIEKLVREAKRKRVNRAYYEKYYYIKNLREAGFIQDEKKTLMDRVQLDLDNNELIYLFGFDQSQHESQFNLRLSVASLYPEGLDGTKGEESRWRLANVNFKLALLDATTGESTTYSYAHEQLIDYQEKRENATKHDHCSVYKVGSISIEQVLPFSMSRILFNGLMEVRRADGSVSHEPMRLSISTHPTSDKLDYTYRFSVQHTTDIIKKSLKDGEDKRHLLDLALENRFDQPLMFQGHLESLDGDHNKLDEKFVFWGAKVKEFLNVPKELATADDRDCLFAWTEAGQQIHLSRPKKRSNLVYGLIHNSFDYSSHLYGAKLFKIELGEEKEVDFSELESFSELASNYKIKLRGFKTKWYTIEVCQNDFKLSNEATFKVKLNGFEGLAMRTSLGLVAPIRAAQSKLLTLTIGDPVYGFPLANERLLGGKGNSLMDLSHLVFYKQLSTTGFSREPKENVEVLVPRGLVLTTRAYKMWLDSNPSIAVAIEELDLVRRNLAAKSIYLNPMSKEYVSLSAQQKILRESCERTSSVLKSMPLPNQLKNQVYNELVRIFGKDQLDEKEGKLFAVRSSAVGEDSLETSAAGQMKTILDARGFQTICQAIVDCWTSQFEIEATTYKTQNGLSFNLPMAVVVQELIPCHVAGVAATCDPLDGNKKRLEITANFGLGEGVVSGKKTDTVRVSLDKLPWNEQLEDHVGRLYLPDHLDQIKKPAGDEDCCLTNEQIVALANLLLEVRRLSAFKEREVEWGITVNDQDTSSSDSSSSSSSGSGYLGSRFRVHLLQSRPLTNLQRLTSREIEHELDYGFPCARDSVSRANLGEVMPGALCSLNSSFAQPIAGSYITAKPYEPNQSRQLFVADSSAFYAQMMIMVSTYSDTLRQIARANPDEQQTAKRLIYYMVGATYDDPKTEEESDWWRRFIMEKIHPLARESNFHPRRLAMLQFGLHSAQMKLIKRGLRRTVLQEDLPSFKELESNKNLTFDQIHAQIQLLYKRITSEIEYFCLSWVSHIQSTMLNITINYICLKMLSKQEAYAGEGNLVATETLNDFSALMRPSAEEIEKFGKNTESGDISRLIELLLKCLVEENLLDRAKAMQPAELYDFFTDEKSQLRCCKLYRDFMKRNGHRAFREFCLSTITWSDDSSYIMRLLAMRLKTYTPEEQAKQDAKRAEMEREHEAKRREIEAKITSLKAPLKWAFSQARESTTRREATKSLLIKAVHKYRLAFRHLGGLLCLAGLMPSVDLVFWLSIEELDDVVKCCSANGASERDSLMPRLLYKARRRQQRARAFDGVKFPKPTLTLNEMFRTIQEQSEPAPLNPVTSEGQKSAEEIAASSNRVQVAGLISCAGRVTGRACVITSIDQMDQVQQGDILVTYSIDTSWTVYFFALAGIVTELGGIVSHGAVVAREYGIPTLCTAIDACSKFKTGQILTLDANAGVCYLAEDSANTDNGDAETGTKLQDTAT